MRAFVLGARGAVGAATTAELRRHGHEAIGIGRSSGNEIQLDISTATGLAALLATLEVGDVVINASGQEHLEFAGLAAAAHFVEVSATGRYLDELRGLLSTETSPHPAATPEQAAARAAAPLGASGTTQKKSKPAAVLGAGIAPGLSTVLLAALDSRPGDELDLGVTLGSGEKHGAAAVQWTESLIGAPIYRSRGIDGKSLQNFRETRLLPGLGGKPRTHLLADFPDQVILGDKSGVLIRSHLALSSTLMTQSLRTLARFPQLARLMRSVPPIGSETWRIVALNRRTREQIAVEGEGQSHATGVLAAFTAERLTELRAGSAIPAMQPGALNMADLCTAEEAAERLGLRLLRG